MDSAGDANPSEVLVLLDSEEEGSVSSRHYEIEDVLRRRTKNGMTEFLIKWKGCPESENTWEPQANLSTAGLEMALERLPGKAIRCGVCDGCSREDCGSCPICRDKPKFGGPGIRKEVCTKKKCELLERCRKRRKTARSPQAANIVSPTSDVQEDPQEEEAPDAEAAPLQEDVAGAQIEGEIVAAATVKSDPCAERPPKGSVREAQLHYEAAVLRRQQQQEALERDKVEECRAMNRRADLEARREDTREALLAIEDSCRLAKRVQIARRNAVRNSEEVIKSAEEDVAAAFKALGEALTADRA